MNRIASRYFIRMFQPRFAALVAAGTKLQTVRPKPARVPRVGDVIDCREWTGKPYRSKQRIIATGHLVEVSEVIITSLGIYKCTWMPDREAFAKADGFASFYELRDWFLEQHGLPFGGILLRWNLPQSLNPQLSTLN